MTYVVDQLAAILATALFIFSLYWMNDPKTARHAVAAGVAGMLVAVLATWFQPAIVHHGWIVVAIAAVFCTVPNAPNSTLVNDRFMARHMMIERIKIGRAHV